MGTKKEKKFLKRISERQDNTKKKTLRALQTLKNFENRQETMKRAQKKNNAEFEAFLPDGNKEFYYCSSQVPIFGNAQLYRSKRNILTRNFNQTFSKLKSTQN